MKNLIVTIISILLGLSLGMITLYQKKINSIVEYNNKQNIINTNIINANKENNNKLDKYFKKMTQNMTLNYKEYAEQYKKQKEEEMKLLKERNIKECKNIFSNYLNAIIIYPSKDYIRFIFLKTIYKNFINDFYRKTKISIKQELGSYGYETYYNVRKFNKAKYINSFVYIKTPTKYNIFDINIEQDGIPNIYTDKNITKQKYLTILSSGYNIDKINLSQLNKGNKIYTDLLVYYKPYGSDIIGLVKTYYSVFKKCNVDSVIGTGEKINYNVLGKECGYLSNKDINKLYKSYLNTLKLKYNYIIMDDKIEKKYSSCLNLSGNLANYIANNIDKQLNIIKSKVRIDKMILEDK